MSKDRVEVHDAHPMDDPNVVLVTSQRVLDVLDVTQASTPEIVAWTADYVRSEIKSYLRAHDLVPDDDPPRVTVLVRAEVRARKPAHRRRDLRD